MAYLLNTQVSDIKVALFELQKIYGINKSKAFVLCKRLGISKNCKIKNLSSCKIKHLSKIIEMSHILLANALKKRNTSVIEHLVSIKSYRGLRRLKGLPVRGQRTHTNASTALRNKKI